MLLVCVEYYVFKSSREARKYHTEVNVNKREVKNLGIILLLFIYNLGNSGKNSNQLSGIYEIR